MSGYCGLGVCWDLAGHDGPCMQDGDGVAGPDLTPDTEGSPMTALPFHGTAPTRVHEGDAGLDLRAAEGVTLMQTERALVPTGTRVALPPGTVGLIFGRSGLAARHGIGLTNGVGVIDAGYRGELMVNLINHGPAHTIRPGDRIAQLLVVPILLLEPTPVPSAHHLGFTDRGAGGHGSTGR